MRWMRKGVTYVLGLDSQEGSWERMWRLSVDRRVKVLSQPASSHLYGRLPVCVRLWRARLLESPNHFPQPGYSQQCGRSPVWTRMCTWRAER
jgi:hypothetical protein